MYIYMWYRNTVDISRITPIKMYYIAVQPSNTDYPFQSHDLRVIS